MRKSDRFSMFRVVALSAALALGGCATQFGQKIESVASAISGTTVDPTSIIIASNTFDALQAGAARYLRLKRCTGANGPICRSPAATKPLIAAVKAGRQARDAAQEFVKAHPGQLGPQGLYDALTGSVDLIRSIFTTYNIEGTAS